MAMMRTPEQRFRDALADRLAEAYATDRGRRLDQAERDLLWRLAEATAPALYAEAQAIGATR